MFLTTDGRPAAEPSRPTVQALGGDGALLGRLEVAPELADRIELVEALAAAAGVALDNARLQAELRAERREVLEAATRLAESRAAEERLAHLLPGGVAERLRADPEALTRTERLTATVLMSDVRGYSTLAETMPPGTLAVALNEHRAAMNEAILRSGGTVVQYVGDAVLAAFTDVQGPAHAERALAAALAMQAAQQQLDAEWARRRLPPFGLGIGISTGEVAVAFLGSAERAEYTVVGDTVNLAARLTDAARPAGTVIADRATVEGVAGRWVVEPLGLLSVKGRVAEVAAYRVLGANGPAVAHGLEVEPGV